MATERGTRGDGSVRADRAARRDKTPPLSSGIDRQVRERDPHELETGSESHILTLLRVLADVTKNCDGLDLRDRWYLSALLVRERVRRLRLKNAHDQGKVTIPRVLNLEDL